MKSTISGFDTEKAKEYVLNYEPPEIRDFAKLLFYRDIEGVSITILENIGLSHLN